MQSATINIDDQQHRAISVYRALRFQQLAQNRSKKYSHQPVTTQFRTQFKRSSCYDIKRKYARASIIDIQPYNNNRTHVDFHDFRELNQKELFGHYDISTKINNADKYWHTETRKEKIKHALRQYRKASMKDFFGKDYDLKTGVAKTPTNRKIFKRTASTILANVDQSAIIYSC